jgi:hypothetical protein
LVKRHRVHAEAMSGRGGRYLPRTALDWNSGLSWKVRFGVSHGRAWIVDVCRLPNGLRSLQTWADGQPRMRR